MNLLKFILIFVFLNQLSSEAQQTELPLLSPAQAKSDISFFENIFFDAHINLALVCDTSMLRYRIDTLQSGITDSISATELYRRLMPVFSSIRDIHCALNLPPESNDYLQAGKPFLPLDVFISNGSLYVRGDYFDSCITGDKIFSINNIPADSIYPVLMMLSSSEGNNIHSREKIAEYYFTSVYPLFFFVDSINTIQTGTDSTTHTCLLPGVDANKEPYHSYFSGAGNESIKPFSFGYSKDRTIAYMRIASFMNGNPGEYHFFLNNAFRNINAKQPKVLILDLRHNGGGFADYGKLLTRFLMQEPYTYVNHLISKSSSIVQHEIIRQTPFQPEIVRLLQCTFGNKAMRALWHKTEGIVDTTWEKQVKPIQSAKNYSGFLVVLFNGMSASTTGLVCNTLRKRPNTLFAGLPAGCAISGTFGQPTPFELPNSGITGTISILRFNQDTAPPVLTPITPDIVLPENSEDLESGNDTQLVEIIHLIRKKISEQ
ncbi:MAG TPA: S41 family peptidase [Bacteroidales bacterium]|nr:S41 family peptidase [Bacteroidales bacterium]